MTVGRFVDYDPTQRTYVARRRARRVADRRGRAREHGQLGSVRVAHGRRRRRDRGELPDRRRCARTQQFPKFQELMASMSADVHDAALIDRDAAARRRDHRTPRSRHRRVRHRLRRRARDEPAGDGVPKQPVHWVGLLAKRASPRPPPSRRSSVWTNTLFEVKDAVTIDGSKKFDFITVFDAIHDQAQPDKVLAEHRDLARAGWSVPLRRHRRLEQRRGEHGAPARRRCSTASRPSTA